MHAQSLRAAGLTASGIHIRQIPPAHVICITSGTLKIKTKTHKHTDLLRLYKDCWIHLCMLVDQNMVYGSNTDQRNHFPRIQQVVPLFSGIHQICIPTFPFDPPTQVIHMSHKYSDWLINQGHEMNCRHLCCSDHACRNF